MKTIKAEYSKAVSKRQHYIDRAVKNARYTLPNLFRETSDNEATPTKDNHDSLGARGVNNLSSKLLTALFPPNRPFFKFSVDPYTLDNLSGQPEQKAQVESVLGKIERTVQSKLEQSSVRVDVLEAFKHLLVSGNGVLFVNDELNSTFYNLHKYIVKRDPEGSVKVLIIKESVDVRTLKNEELKEAILAKLKDKSDFKEDEEKSFVCDLYTKISFEGSEAKMNQEVEGELLWKEGEFTYPADACPWIVLRYTKVSGEDYGRSFVEDYVGDLKSLESLSKAIVDVSQNIAKLVLFLDPNQHSLNTKDIIEAENGSVLSGNASDVSVLQIAKTTELSVAQQTASGIRQSLSADFLMTQSVTRSAERVTAEEVRLMASELESGLNGVYSLLSRELQHPLVKRVLNVLGKTQSIPQLPKDEVEPVVVTGTEALARGGDLERLDMLIGGIGQTFGAEAVGQYINIGDYITKRATALGLDPEGIIKSPEQIQQEQQAAQMQQMMENPQVQQLMQQAQGGMPPEAEQQQT